MVLKTEELDVIIFIMCGCGLGDQYTSILTAYHMFSDFNSQGLNVGVAWNKNNLYFPSEISMEIIFDLSGFNTDIGEYIHDEIHTTLNDFRRIEKFKTVEVYVKNKIDFVENYVPTSYSRSHWRYSSGDFKDFNVQFVQQEILNVVDRLFPKNDSVFGIHFRLPDLGMILNLDEIKQLHLYGAELKKIENFLTKNTNQLFMVSSNNDNFLNYIKSNFGNVFINTFSNSLEKHNLYKTYANKIDTSILIQHTKEILTEMVMFSKCKKIYSVNTFPSNFVSYGYIHNKFYKPWFNHINKIDLDINI